MAENTSKIIFNETALKGYGKCLSVSNETQQMLITLDLGPRIIDYRLRGKANMMFQDIDRKVFHKNDSLSEFFGEGSVWYLYGGHRFWVSPEAMPETYYPDNEKVDYEISGDTVFLYPSVQKGTGWKQTLAITMNQTNGAEIKHILENTSDSAKEGSIWALSVLAAGGIAGICQANEDTGFLANRTLMMWSYNDFLDSRFIAENEHFFVKQDPDIEKAFKIGTNNTKGTAAYFNHDTMFVKKYFPDHENCKYPDNGVSTEIYVNDLFLELESLGPLKILEKGQSSVHTEYWTLFDIPENSKDSEFDTLKKFI